MEIRDYGDDKTIHQTEAVNVERDPDGNVVAVWFRCQPLPFTDHQVEEARAQEMTHMYERDSMPRIIAVKLAE